MGSIKWQDERGFGFIQPIDGSREIFLHITELKDVTRRPHLNDTIYYRSTVESDGKVRACDAFILGARKMVSPSNLSSRAVSPLSFPTLGVLFLSVLPLAGSVHFAWATRNSLPLILYPVMSLLTYMLYADDKSRAQRKAWRTREISLHLSELVGGWPGGFVAQRMLRHKISKRSYQATFWTIVVFHYLGWLTWLALSISLKTYF